MRKIKYKLFAMETSQTALDAVEGERFYRVGPTHILVYRMAGKKRLPGTVDIKDAALLSTAEAAWLRVCNEELLLEFAKEHVEKNRLDMGGFMETFRAELEKERQRLSAGEDPAEKGGEETVCT